MEKLKYLREVNFFEGTELEKLNRREKWEQAEADIRTEFSAPDVKAMKRHGYSGLSVQQRAEAVGLGAKYQHVYRIASRSIHTFDPAETGIMDYMNDEDAVAELLESRHGALESAQNMLIGRLSLIVSEIVDDPLVEGELWLLGLGYEKYRDRVDGLSTTVDGSDPETFYVWRE